MSHNEESIESLLSTDSFVAWIEGKATRDETEQWREWVDDDPARKQLVQKAKILHRNIAFKPGLHHDSEAELEKFSKAVKEADQSRKPKVFQLNSRTYYSAVAAVIVLLITVIGVIGYLNPGMYFGYSDGDIKNQFVTNTTTDGQQKELTLYDDSKITLNANSSIRYPAEYHGGDLEVWLEGEAFFDVFHHTGADERSLTVHVTEGSIKVLGTKFNVNTFEDVTEVVLIEGSVSVEKKDGQNRKILKPGEMSRIPQPDEKITVNKVRAELFTSWTKDKLIFDDVPLREVIRRVEHLYGVQFELGDRKLQNSSISGSLPNNNLDVFLNALEKIVEEPVTKRDKVITVGVIG